MYIYLKLFDAPQTFAVIYLHILTCASFFFFSIGYHNYTHTKNPF